MMPVNWFLEALKWRFIISKEEKISISHSLLAVLGGITVSMLTPNRTGEYLGRVFILKSPVKGILLTLTGSFSQLIITFILGCISLIFTLPILVNYLDIDAANGLQLIRLVLLLFIFSAFFVYFYFPLSYKITEMPVFRRFEKFKNYAALSKAFTKTDLFKILSISLLRYMVFTTQYYLLLLIFGIDIRPVEAFLLISIQYFIMAFIPSIALSEIGFRGSVAIFIFSVFAEYSKNTPLSGDQALSVAFASVALWIINLAVPALAGIPVILRTNFFRE